jgi:hypothetical protein
MMKDKFLPYKLIGNVTYPMRPWFYFPFKGEKYGLSRYNSHWNFIQSSTRMSMENTFGMLKSRLKHSFKNKRHSIMPHATLGHGLHMFTQHVHY